MSNVDIEGGEEELHAHHTGRKYRPVVANDRAVLEMSSLDPGSIRSPSHASCSGSLKNVKVDVPVNMNSNARVSRGSSVAKNVGVNGSERDSKLELFGFDSLVNILGLRRIQIDRKLPVVGDQKWVVWICSFNVPVEPGKTRSIVYSARNFFQLTMSGSAWWFPLRYCLQTEAELLVEKRYVAHLMGEGIAYCDLP